MTAETPHRRFRNRYVIVAILAVLALIVGIALPILTSNGSATDRVKADPPPTLFSEQQMKPVISPIDAQDPKASRAMASWWKEHGSVRDDQAFLTWVEGQVPDPPVRATRSAELRQVKLLKEHRTTGGVAAATWLEVHGKKDIWKLYQHDQKELQSPAVGKANKADLKTILSMAKTAADKLGTSYHQSAPYVLDPTLRPDHTVEKGQVCPCSYPSRHSARAAGARTFLGEIAPRRMADYSWMENEIAFSRLYMAGHVLSDITAGSRLGDMIGQYVLVSRGHMPIPK
jgi:hypothetical protein